MRKALLASIMTLSLAVGLAAQSTSSIPGLIGWWKFNEPSGVIAYDSSGNGNNGTLVSTAYFTSDSQRVQVLNVAGANGEVDYAFTTLLQPVSGTIAVWVKPTQAVTADVIRQDTDYLIRSGMSGTFYVYDLRVTSKGQACAIIANDDPKSNGKFPQIVVCSPAQVKLGVWTHLVMRWDSSSGVLSIFVNSKLAGKAPYSPVPGLGLSYGTSPMKVAAAIWDFGTGYLEYFGGLSDFRFYGRALTDTEIANVYAGK